MNEIRTFNLGSKEVLVKIEDRADKKTEKEAIVMWKSIKDRLEDKVEGETTSLFYEVDAYLQEYSNEHNITLHFLFTTFNEKLKLWFKKNAVDFGFNNIRYIEDEGIMAGDKYYYPQE